MRRFLRIAGLTVVFALASYLFLTKIPGAIGRMVRGWLPHEQKVFVPPPPPPPREAVMVEAPEPAAQPMAPLKTVEIPGLMLPPAKAQAK